jgi:hypothetical protein
MDAAVPGGLVEQWVWRCQMVATRYQLRQPIDLKMEVEKLVGQAETQARLMQADGSAFLSKVETRLDVTAHIAVQPDKVADPLLNVLGRAEALHALADAFGHAAERLRLGA